MQFIIQKLINVTKITYLVIFVLLSIYLLGCKGNASMGYRTSSGWYFYWCHRWVWESDYAEACPKEEENWYTTPANDYIPPYRITPGSTGVQYGYDDFYDITDTENSNNVYISLANRSSTEVELNLMNMNYSNYTISAKPSNLISVSTFDANGNKTSNIKKLVTNKILIESLGGTGTVTIVITGTNADSEETVISGCDECDVNYIIKVYNMVNIDRYPVYNLSGENINATNIKLELNRYLKLAVGEFTSLNVTNISPGNWDKNGNGIVDFCLGAGAYEEFYRIEDAIASQIHTNIDDLWTKNFIAVLPSTEIREHYYISEKIPLSSRTIRLNSIQQNNQSIKIGTEIKIGNWLTESNPNFETYIIDNIDYNTNTITINRSTTREHLSGETFYSTLNGFTSRNYSYVKKNAVYATWLHEILHQERFGNFPHVGNGMADKDNYTMNIMYPYGQTNLSIKNKLCGRQLMIFQQTTYESKSQWDRFHDAMR